MVSENYSEHIPNYFKESSPPPKIEAHNLISVITRSRMFSNVLNPKEWRWIQCIQSTQYTKRYVLKVLSAHLSAHLTIVLNGKINGKQAIREAN